MKLPKLIAHTLGLKEAATSSEQLVDTLRQPWVGFVVKTFISLAAVYFIWNRVITAEQQLSLFEVLSAMQFELRLIPLLLAALTFMVLNWGMEVVKWKYLVGSQFPLTWKGSVKGVLSGITFGLFTPNRVGELFGRVLVLESGQRIQGAMLSFVNGVAQTIATLTFGVLGIQLLLIEFGSAALGWIPTVILQVTVGLTLLLSLILFFRLELFADLLLRFKRLQAYAEHVRVFERLPSELLWKLYGLSLVRFLTFVLQYLVVFQWMMPQYSVYEVLSASVLTMFSITLLPFFPVPDLLLRESFALGYFELYHFDPIVVSIVVFLVWGINVAFPALMGVVTLYTYRIFEFKR